MEEGQGQSWRTDPSAHGQELGFLGRGTQNHKQPGSPQYLTDLHT